MAIGCSLARGRAGAADEKERWRNLVDPKISSQDDPTPTRRRHVGMTLPRRVKEGMLEAAGVMDWSAGQWLLAAAAEQGPRLREALGQVSVAKRPRVEDATFTALYLTADERDELDDQARACGLNRSAFVTSVARLGLGDDLGQVVGDLRSRGPA
jgi:hypothetical protein